MTGFPGKAGDDLVTGARESKELRKLGWQLWKVGSGAFGCWEPWPACWRRDGPPYCLLCFSCFFLNRLHVRDLSPDHVCSCCSCRGWQWWQCWKYSSASDLEQEERPFISHLPRLSAECFTFDSRSNVPLHTHDSWPRHVCKNLFNRLMAGPALSLGPPTPRPVPSHVAVPRAQRLSTRSGGPMAWGKIRSFHFLAGRPLTSQNLFLFL